MNIDRLLKELEELQTSEIAFIMSEIPEEVKQYYGREGYAEHFINAPCVMELIGPVATYSEGMLLYVTFQFFYLKTNPGGIDHLN